LKTFIPVSWIFDNEDDIFIFSRNVRKSSAIDILLKNDIGEISSFFLKGTVCEISNDLKGEQCPIYNGTLKNLVYWSSRGSNSGNMLCVELTMYCISLFPWKVTWNYVNSSFKVLNFVKLRSLFRLHKVTFTENLDFLLFWASKCTKLHGILIFLCIFKISNCFCKKMFLLFFQILSF